MDGRTILDLAEGLQLRRVRVMGANRIELSGFTDTMRDRLKAYGLFHEIISWKLRMFVPTDASGVEVLAKVLDRYRDRAHRRAGGRVMPRDASELAHRLAREAEAVCRHYLSNGRREGRYWLVGDVRNTPGRSMFVRLKGPEAGAAPPANGPTPPRASMAICSTSSAKAAAFSTSTTSPTRRVAS